MMNPQRIKRGRQGHKQNFVPTEKRNGDCRRSAAIVMKGVEYLAKGDIILHSATSYGPRTLLRCDVGGGTAMRQGGKEGRSMCVCVCGWVGGPGVGPLKRLVRPILN
jgi:hypothetical protein